LFDDRIFSFFVLFLFLTELIGRETVHFQYSYFEIATGAQRGIVEGLASVRLAESDVLVHPDRLALAVKKGNFCHLAKKKKSSTVRCVTVAQVQEVFIRGENGHSFYFLLNV
jgi:hypothetical protein